MIISVLLTINHKLWWIAGEVTLYLFCFIVVVAIIVYALRGPLRKHKRIDLLIFKKLSRFRSAANDRLMLAFTFLAKHPFLVPANLLLVAIFINQKNYEYAFRIVVMQLSSLLMMFILKYLFHRKRPQVPLLFNAKGKSFPSGHAIMAINFYGLLLYMLWQTNTDLGLKTVALIFTILLVLTISFSRIYLQVHYPSDVVAGIIIGICWFYISLHLLNRLAML